MEDCLGNAVGISRPMTSCHPMRKFPDVVPSVSPLDNFIVSALLHRYHLSPTV